METLNEGTDMTYTRRQPGVATHRRWMATLVITAASLLPLFGTGCNRQPAAGQSAPQAGGAKPAAGGAANVSVITVPRIDVVKTVKMPGSVEGFATAALYSRVGGYLDEFVTHPVTGLPVDIGDVVTEGQELARLHAPEMLDAVAQKQALIEQAQADVTQAAAAIQQAEAEVTGVSAAEDEARTELAEKDAQLQFRGVELKRYEELVQNNSVRRELLDQSRFQYEAAKSARSTVEARIRTAQANLASAKAGLAKAQADQRSAEARVKVARADAAYTQTMLSYATIRAPFDGVITQRSIDPGAFVQPAEGNSAAKPILTITKTDVVRVFVDIPMTDAQWIDRGDKAVLDQITSLPGATFPGTVTRFSPSVGSESRMMRAEVDLDNADGRLRPGYYGYMTVHLEEQPATPVIPSSALQSDADGLFVFIVDGGTVHRREVTVNFRDGSMVGIESGLSGGESVVRSSGGQLSEGQTVTAATVDWKP